MHCQLWLCFGLMQVYKQIQHWALKMRDHGITGSSEACNIRLPEMIIIKYIMQVFFRIM